MRLIDGWREGILGVMGDDLDRRPILPVPLVRWTDYAAFNAGGGFEAIVAACGAGDPGSPGPFRHARADHLETELVAIDTVGRGAGGLVRCHAGLADSEWILADLGGRLAATLDPAPVVSKKDFWTIYEWSSPPRLRTSAR